MLTVDEALRNILAHGSPLPARPCRLTNAAGRVLAASLSTPHDSPPFDKAMMDGFAVCSRALLPTDSDSVLTLRVLETITAGTVPTQSPGSDSACRIMTGAPLPDGADCVVPIEQVRFDDTAPAVVDIPAECITAERHVLRQSATVASGTRLLEKGTVLRPQHIAVLAEFGLSEIPVVPAPSVAVLATGDELIPVQEPLFPGRIRNSNEPMLTAQIRRAEADPCPLGIARDDPGHLKERIETGLACDVLLLSGGVSAGTRDLVPQQLQAAGVEEVFHKVQMKPGKPLWFGVRSDGDRRCLVVGLPGNPVSSMVCFEVFVRPLLDSLAGRPERTDTRSGTARLTKDLSVRGNRTTFYPAVVIRSADGLSATPVDWGGSADLISTAQATGLCRLEPRDDTYRAGDMVPVLCWDPPEPSSAS